MKVEDLTPEDMEITLWNIIDDLATEQSIIDYLVTAFEEPTDATYIRHAVKTAIEAANTHGLFKDDEEDDEEDDENILEELEAGAA